MSIQLTQDLKKANIRLTELELVVKALIERVEALESRPRPGRPPKVENEA